MSCTAYIQGPGRSGCYRNQAALPPLSDQCFVIATHRYVETQPTLPIGCSCNPNRIITFNRPMLCTCKLQIVTTLLLCSQPVVCHHNSNCTATYNRPKLLIVTLQKLLTLSYYPIYALLTQYVNPPGSKS